MGLSACRCTFERNENSPREEGIAITREHGLSDVIAIMPDTGKAPSDALVLVYNYILDWTHSIDGDFLGQVSEAQLQNLADRQ